MNETEVIDITPEQIKELLEKSGYLFEQKVASTLEKIGFVTHTNRAYLDADEGKSREIDVLAYKPIYTIEEPETSGYCYINCECKNSINPYVFITRNKGLVDTNYIPDGLFFFPKEYKTHINDNRYLLTIPFKKLDLYKHHYATREEYKVVQISKIVRNQKKVEVQHNGIIESFIYPLIKSKQIWEREFVHTNNKFCQFFFNLVVVNSTLYTIDSEDENALPKKVDFVPFIRDVQTKNIQGKHLITFVNYDYLEQFIKIEVEGFCQKVGDIYENNKSLLNEKH